MRNLNPITKLIAVMLITAVIFFVDKLSVCVILTAVLILFRLMTRISFLKIKHILNLLMLAVFVILLQTFFGGGLLLGLAITCRIFSLMLIFPILTETTAAHSLAASLHSLGFNYRIAFIITTAVNQVPHFSEEARLIMDAQRLRGLSAFDISAWKPGGQIARIKAYAGISLPLVLGAMRKAKESSIAMDSRAFGARKTRTWLEKPVMNARDYLFILGCIIFSALLLIFNYGNYQF